LDLDWIGFVGAANGNLSFDGMLASGFRAEIAPLVLETLVGHETS